VWKKLRGALWHVARRVFIYPAGDVKHIADIPVGVAFVETLRGDKA